MYRAVSLRFPRALLTTQVTTSRFLFFSVRVSPTVVPSGTNLVSACVNFLHAPHRTFEKYFPKDRPTSPKPKDGLYPITQRVSDTPMERRERESQLSRRPTLVILRFRIG
jgi:hypothetical protein